MPKLTIDKIINDLILPEVKKDNICMFCGSDSGLKIICDNEICKLYWEERLRELDRRYATNLTKPYGLTIYWKL